MRMWVGEKYLLSFGCVICFVVYFYIRIINQVLIVYKDAAGLWHEDRFRPLCTAVANLIMNLILVQFIGIYGVLLSTVISTLFIGMPWVIHNIFTVLFKNGRNEYVKGLLKYTFVTLIICVATFGVGMRISFSSDIMTIIVRAIICAILPNILFIVVFRKKAVFKQTIALIDKMCGRKIKIMHKFCAKLM